MTETKTPGTVPPPAPWRAGPSYGPPSGPPFGPPAAPPHVPPAGAPNGPQPNGPQPNGPRGHRKSVRLAAAFAAVAIGAGAIGGLAGGLASANSGTPVASSTLTTSPVSNQSGAPIAEIAKNVSPSVVQVETQTYNGTGIGSGIILSSDGKILTNNHVVADAADGNGEVTVTFNDGKTAKATIVGRDPSSDLAVIQAQGVSGLKAATLGDSSKVQVGDEVVAIGSPEALQGTVTSGIVSALNRPVTVGDDTPQNSPYSRTSQGTETVQYKAIQTDASLNPGNSGGPLLNLNGEVIGINSAIYSPTSGNGQQGGSVGLGFSIPINDAKKIIEQLENGS
jgi:putative serine protease PepD